MAAAMAAGVGFGENSPSEAWDGRKVIASSLTERRTTSLAVVLLARSGSKMSARTKGSEMKMTSNPNPSHQYIDMVSSAGRTALGMA